MNNKRAIELLHRLQDEQFDGIHGDERREALEMAIRAMEEPKTAGSGSVDSDQPENKTDRSTGDSINRQQAIEELMEHFKRVPTIAIRAKKVIEKLPSAQPETPPYVEEIENEYKKWVSMPHINKPLAKALYEVWKKHDRDDAERKE